MLQSVEAIFHDLADSPDYLHPNLKPIPTIAERKYWRPTEEQNPLNSWSHRCDITAEKPTSSLLKGRTIAIKDNISVGGLPTVFGTVPQLLSRKSQYPISPIDASVVSRVLEAGGRVIGTAVCEAYSASPLSFSSSTGPVHNAWAHGMTAGGSSSGCAALLGANVVMKERGDNLGDAVDMALGGDQGGSIRIPAAYNGIYGMKATYGLIPFTGVATLSPMLDHVGPMACNLQDIATLLQVLAGYDGIDSRMTPETPLRSQVKDYPTILSDFLSRPLKPEEKLGTPFKVGLLKESFSVIGMSDQVRDIVQESARKYFSAGGAEVVDISVPLHKEGPAIWTAATRASMADWACAGFLPGYLTYVSPHVSLRWPPDQEMYELFTAANPSIMNMIFSSIFLKEKWGPQVEAKAHRKVFELRAAYDEALQHVDVLITPTIPSVAMPHPQLTTPDGMRTTIMEKAKVAIGIVANAAPFNVTGHPAMSVPCGFGTYHDDQMDKSLPVGMQIIAKRWDEETILKVAAVFDAGRGVGNVM
jgi:amidase